MRLYLAGLYTANISLQSNFYRRSDETEKAARRGIKHLLESYYYVSSDRKADEIRRDGVKVFLDSGAFSAYTLGSTIDLGDFCDYCHRHQDIIEVVSVLDAIGDALVTYQNQVAMERRGIRPLPCFHHGEDERYLEHYVANYDHITLGGIAAGNKQQLTIWLDRIWGKYLTNKDGMPKLKVHGFGLTRLDLMQRYPWYSIDSSSWVQNAAHGGIMIPEYGTIFVSAASPSRKEEGRHFRTISPMEQLAIRDAVAKRGFDIDKMADNYITRYTFNMLTFGELSNPDAIPKPFIPDHEGLF